MIKSAAIRVNDKIFTGKNHAECIRAVFIIGLKNGEQGFITDEGIFVDRIEALRIARSCGQIVKKHNPKDKLLSEDLLGNP